MTPLRHPFRWSLALGLCFAVALAASSCTEKPTQPEDSNPLDPNGTGGDPYELEAEVTADSVTLTWNEIPGIARWVVYHSSVSEANLVAVSGLRVARLEAEGKLTVGHHGYAPGVTNWYKVQAVPPSEIPVPLSVGEAVTVGAPPLIQLAGGGTVTPTRFVQLEMRNDRGGQFELSQTRGGEDTTLVDVTSGELVTRNWTLAPVDSIPTDVQVYYRTIVGGTPSALDSLTLQADFEGGLEVVSGATAGQGSQATARELLVVLRSTAEGALGMRLSIDGGDTLDVADPDSIPVVLSADSQDIVTLSAFYASDFGPEKASGFALIPLADVTDARISLADSLTSSRTIEIQCNAPNATMARFAESLDFGDAPWVPFAETIEYELSEGAGEKTVYGIFANPWDPGGEFDSLRVRLIGKR